MEIRGTQDQWTTTNAAGLKQLIKLAGFRIESASRPYALAYGPGFKQRIGWKGLRGWIRRSPRQAVGNLGRAALAKIIGGHSGPAHVAVLARPDI
jgi:hypothetical protein